MKDVRNGRMPWLIWLAKHTYSKKLCAHGRLVLKNDSGVDLKHNNYLYLINHAGIMDPVLVSSVIPRHVRWVAGAYLFKSFFLRLIIGHACTAIPKQQGRGDLSTLKTIKAALESGDNVGLFPEGTRTWDGEMMPVDYKALAKFVRFCKASILFVSLEGAFAQQPRWADFKRDGGVTVHVKSAIEASEIEQMDVDTLSSRISEGLRFSNDEWKETVSYSYPCTRRAEGIQRLLYMCPVCRSIDSIKAEGNVIRCSKCETEAVLDEKDNLRFEVSPAGRKAPSFKTLHEWHVWEAGEIGGAGGFAEEKGVLLQTGDADDAGRLETVSEDITVHLDGDVLRVKCNDKGAGKEICIPLGEITSMVLNAKQTMELFCNDVLYRIRLLPEACSLKYHEFYTAYSKNDSEE